MENRERGSGSAARRKMLSARPIRRGSILRLSREISCQLAARPLKIYCCVRLRAPAAKRNAENLRNVLNKSAARDACNISPSDVPRTFYSRTLFINNNNSSSHVEADETSVWSFSAFNRKHSFPFDFIAVIYGLPASIGSAEISWFTSNFGVCLIMHG